jgi:putative ABC transport system ATP-binding protein
MLKLDRISKSYRTTEVETRALQSVSLEISAGEFVAIMGPSGCGKSTLLNILGLLDNPTGGSYWFLGEDVSKYPESKLTVARRAAIGFVFQSFNLIDDLNVSENVEVALLYRGIARIERKQQQRVAIARALVAEPTLILADEPTGNLDTENSSAVMNLLCELNSTGTTIVMVTHSLEHAMRTRRTVKLLDGHVVSETLLAA